MPWIRCFVLFWAWALPQWVNAQTCTSITPTLSPAPASVYTVAASPTIVWSGTLTIVYTNCVRFSGVGLTEISAFGPAFTSLGGLSSASIRATSFTVVKTSTCTGWSVPSVFIDTGRYRANIFHGSPNTNPCSYTVTVGLEIQTTDIGGGGVYASTSSPVTPLGGWHQSSSRTGGVQFSYQPNLQIDFRNLTCTLTVSNMTVALDPIQNTALIAQPNGPLKSFNIALGNCRYQSSPYALALTFAFTAGPQANLIANTAPSGAAANVYVQLLDTTQTPIANNTTVSYGTLPANWNPATPLNATFYARYATTGNPGAGQVRGIAQLTITYP